MPPQALVSTTLRAPGGDHGTHWMGHLIGSIALVEVDPSRHQGHFDPIDVERENLARVAHHGGGDETSQRPGRDFGEGRAQRLSTFLPARAEHDRHVIGVHPAAHA